MLPRTEEHNKAYRNPDNDPKGPWRSGDVRSPSPRPTLRFPIETPSGGSIDPPANGWRWSHESVQQKIASGEIVFSSDETRIIRKIYRSRTKVAEPRRMYGTAATLASLATPTGKFARSSGAQSSTRRSPLHSSVGYFSLPPRRTQTTSSLISSLDPQARLTQLRFRRRRTQDADELLA